MGPMSLSADRTVERHNKSPMPIPTSLQNENNFYSVCSPHETPAIDSRTDEASWRFVTLASTQRLKAKHNLPLPI